LPKGPLGGRIRQLRTSSAGLCTFESISRIIPEANAGSSIEEAVLTAGKAVSLDTEETGFALTGRANHDLIRGTGDTRIEYLLSVDWAITSVCGFAESKRWRANYFLYASLVDEE
jgi:hypothetical protein